MVCEYWPAGNVVGADGDTRYFKENVFPLVEGKQTDTVESGVTASSEGGRREVRWWSAVLVVAGVVGLGLL